jgi:predicted ester cyclase
MSHTATDINRAAADLTHAFNDADWDRFRNGLAPDAVYNETGTGRRVVGADAYLALCKGCKVAIPDVSGSIRKSVAGDGTVAQEVLWEGTHTGPMQTSTGTIEPTGNRVSVLGTLWVTFEGEKAREVTHHLDVLTVLQQMGALPG